MSRTSRYNFIKTHNPNYLIKLFLDEWEDMQHDNHGDAWKWSNIEHCPLNDYAPEGKALHKIVEEMADDHDIFSKKLLDAYEKMIQNGYDYSTHELRDAPINSWFGYYTMESKKNII